MANNYTVFSFIVPVTKEVAEEVYDNLENEDICTSIFGDSTYELTISVTPGGIWLYCEENGNPDDAAKLLVYLINHYNLPPQGFEWANFCSKSRLDSFSGGAFWTDGKKQDWYSTSQWLGEHESQLC